MIEGMVVAPGTVSGDVLVEVSLSSRMGRPSPPLEESVPCNERFEIDATSLLKKFMAPGGEIRVSVHDGNRVSDEVRLVPSDASSRSDGPETEHRLTVELILQDAPVVIGRVLDASKVPVEGASVLLSLDATKTLPPTILATRKTAADGHFRLSTTVSGACQFHVLADGEQSLSHEIVVPDAGLYDLGDVHLEGGLSISGVVEPGSPDHSVGRLPLVLHSLGGPQPFVTGQLILQSWEEGLEPAVRSLQTEENGEFSITGLNPRRYALMVSSGRYGCSLPGVPGNRINVVAPAEDVRLRYDAPAILFQVADANGPLRNARVTLGVDGEPFGGCPTNERGTVYWHVPPEVPCKVQVDCEGYESASLEIVTPSIGVVAQENFTLKPTTLSRLTLSVRAEKRGSRQYIGIGFYRSGSNALVYRFNKSSTDGIYSCTVIPGQYDVCVREGGWQETKSFYRDAVLSVDLAPDEELRREVSLDVGGRVRVRVRGMDETLLPAECRVVDAYGELVTVQYRTLAEDTWHESDLRPHQGVVGTTAWADVTPAFPVGRFELRVSLKGYESHTTPFEVELEKVTSLDVMLKREE